MQHKHQRPLVLVRDLAQGMPIDSCFFLRSATIGSGSGPKLRARIWDRTGEVPLICWEWERGAPLEDGAYHVVGNVTVYQGTLQVTAEEIEPCPIGSDLQELLPAAPRAPEEMWRELESLCAKCIHPHLRALLRLVLQNKTLCQRWRQTPAAMVYHHAYIGGLLEHTLGVAHLARALAECFPWVDRDLLLAAALLHDIGKTEAYTTNGLPDTTDRGRLLGHIYLGVRLVDAWIERLPGFPQELRDRLLHAIGSHHGELQFGALEVPRTPEALLLHFADNLDAKMKAIRDACDTSEGKAWSAPVRALGGERIYLGTREHNTPPNSSKPLEQHPIQRLFSFDDDDPYSDPPSSGA